MVIARVTPLIVQALPIGAWLREHLIGWWLTIGIELLTLMDGWWMTLCAFSISTVCIHSSRGGSCLPQYHLCSVHLVFNNIQWLTVISLHNIPQAIKIFQQEKFPVNTLQSTVKNWIKKNLSFFCNLFVFFILCADGHLQCALLQICCRNFADVFWEDPFSFELIRPKIKGYLIGLKNFVCSTNQN